MAKASEPGQVKTRLCPPLSVEDAARLYRSFLLDKIEQVRGVSSAEPVVAYAPDSAAPLFESLAPALRLVPQGGGDLSARLVSVLECLFGEGFEAAVVMDSDTPTLPSRCLERAVASVASGAHDLVLGPSEDGGYYLIGLRRLHRALLDGMPWSTPAVLEETLGRARALGLEVTQLEPWYDVDTAADLVRLATDLDEGGTDLPRLHTRRLLRETGRIFVSGGRI